jgi:CPA1 family monovalent cation:H+ antiporter
VRGPEWKTFALCAVAVCVTVIVVRIAWLMTYVPALAWQRRRQAPRPGRPPPTLGSGILASWCGMRGIVTLAAALALPAGFPGFPYRDVIIFSAFCVVLTTLVLQGLTLRPLLHFLCLEEDRTVEREVGIARAETARAALRVLDQEGSPSSAADVLRGEYRARIQAEESPEAQRNKPQADGAFAALQRKAVEAQRDELTALRARQVIGDDAFHVVEEEIDLMELTADARVRPLPAG